MRREHYEEIQEIIDKIISGEYEHIQTKVHCGAAHCIAGWKIVRDSKKYPELLNWWYMSDKNAMFIAQKSWNLKWWEADMLFHPTLDIATIEQNLKYLKEKYERYW